MPSQCHFAEPMRPRLRSNAWTGEAENLWHMEKVVLLCLLVAVIGLLAELAPAPQPQPQRKS